MKSRPFILTVDSASPEEPDPRTFATLPAAIETAKEYNERWQPFIWIMERADGRAICHMKDGKLVLVKDRKIIRRETA